jgi:NAD+ synthase (glutamine-hydrolysing)
MKIALAQINTTVGDLAGNETKILDTYRRGTAQKAQLVVFPELATTGYPPRDLLLRPGLVARNLAVLERLAKAAGPVALVVGYVGRNEKRPGREVTNSVALLREGRIVATRTKTLLPTYDVFDEDRYFEPAQDNAPVTFDDAQMGLTICEDVWNDEDYWDERRYRKNPATELASQGAGLLLNSSASPWHLGKNLVRRSMLSRLAARTRCPVVYCNLVGGNDELIFDGGSMVIDARGRLVAEAKRFEEDLLVVDLDQGRPINPPEPPDDELVFRALALGLRDYVEKCGFKSAVLGLSGGIDSAVTACIAVAALGKERVRGVSLPSQFSSQGSLDDARVLAHNLAIRYDVIPIQPAFLAVKDQFKELFAGLPEDVTEENVQARLRGVMLMALSNKFGSLLLTTGNKSELAVGYCTLYGDMCGGLAVIADVPKTMVYRLARWINADASSRAGRETEIIPRASLTKPPSAELRPNQTDQDSLPPYEVLDRILEDYVVRLKTPAEIIASGVAEADVCRVVRSIDLSEYKRRQSAPGLKVTTKAFGIGRRIPIAQRYREW